MLLKKKGTFREEKRTAGNHYVSKNKKLNRKIEI